MIKPINVATNNVARELAYVATQNSTSVSELYIKINSISTFIRDSDSEFVEILNEDFDKYKDELYMRDNTVEFDQEYNIEI